MSNARGKSWMFQKPEVEGCEYQDDSYVHREPFPEPAPEEQDIDQDDHRYHQGYVECDDHLAPHFSLACTLSCTVLKPPDYTMEAKMPMAIACERARPFHPRAEPK
jgi:hypothetical protein